MYNAQVFYIDSLFCKRGAHYKQEQYVSLFFFQTVKSHVYWIYVILENISLCKKGLHLRKDGLLHINLPMPMQASAVDHGFELQLGQTKN